MEFVLGRTTVTYYKKSNLLAHGPSPSSCRGFLYELSHRTRVTFLDFNTLIDRPMHLNGKPFDGEGVAYVFYYDYNYRAPEKGFIRTLCVPVGNVYEENWDMIQAIDNIQSIQRLQRWLIKRYRTPKRKVAFAMALHKRLGRGCVAHGLGIDCTNTILRLLPN